MTDKVQKIKDWISKEQDGLMDAQGNFEYPEHEGAYHILCNLDAYIDSLQEEPVSEDLEEAAKRYATEGDEISGLYIIDVEVDAFKAGAEWKKNHLWKDAQGDDLPDIDREVIVLTRPYPLGENEYTVSFAHRPNPNGWDGKSITTGNIEHYTPKTYDKGGWNIPNIMYWLDVELPKY